MKLMDDYNLRETGRLEVSEESKKVTKRAEFKKDSHARGSGRGQTKYDVHLELKGREIVYQLDRG